MKNKKPETVVFVIHEVFDSSNNYKINYAGIDSEVKESIVDLDGRRDLSASLFHLEDY